MKVKLVFCCFLFWWVYAQSQTCCSAGAALAKSWVIEQEDLGTWNFFSAYEYSNVNRLVNKNEVFNNDPRERYAHSFQLRADYQWKKILAFSLMMPVSFQHRITTNETQSSLGLADVLFLTQVQLIRLKDHQLQLGAGIEFPTGATNRMDFRGIILSPDMQPGSGTWDGVARLTYLKQHLFPNIHLSSGLSYRYNSENSSFAALSNSVGRRFQFGSEWIWETTMQWVRTIKYGFIIPSVGLQLRNSSANREQGFIASNSGGTWLSTPFQLYFSRNDIQGFSLFFSPTWYQQVKGLQISTRYTAGIQWNYRITKKKEESIPKLINIE